MKRYLFFLLTALSLSSCITVDPPLLEEEMYGANRFFKMSAKDAIKEAKKRDWIEAESEFDNVLNFTRIYEGQTLNLTLQIGKNDTVNELTVYFATTELDWGFSYYRGLASYSSIRLLSLNLEMPFHVAYIENETDYVSYFDHETFWNALSAKRDTNHIVVADAAYQLNNYWAESTYSVFDDNEDGAPECYVIMTVFDYNAFPDPLDLPNRQTN